MRVEKEFTVAAPLDRAWEQLTDADALASCLPDVQLPDGARAPLAGRELILGLNGSGARVRATIRGVDADDDAHEATVRIAGHEIAGPGMARGTLRGTLASEDGRTRVRLSADVDLTGRAPAQDAVDRTARRLLDGFAERLEQGMLDRATRPEPAAAQPEAARRAPEAAPRPAAEAPEPAAAGAERGVGDLLSAPAARYGAGAGVLVILLGVLRALLGRGGGGNRVQVSVRYRW